LDHGGKIQDYDTFKVSYNIYGDPVKVRGNQVSTGRPQILIGYDSHGRIKTILHAYDNGFFEIGHKYIYQNNSNVVIDSVFRFGAFDKNTLDIVPSDYGGGEIENKLTFDNQQRLVKIVQTPYFYNGNGFMTKTLSYNTAGNAYKVNTVITSPTEPTTSSDIFLTYDNKINPHRLHIAWQLIDWEFSKNNSLDVVSYNSMGLPAEINVQAYPYTNITGEGFLRLTFNNFQLVYE
jgi:hypothetical protein